jgi:hypothetical protein
LFNINPFFAISPLEEYLNKLENNAVSQEGANAKLKLYYLHIDFGIKPFVQGLFDGGVQYRHHRVLDQEKTNDLVKDQEQKIPATLIVINKNNVHNCHN